jgi:hypothetical protein
MNRDFIEVLQSNVQYYDSACNIKSINIRLLILFISPLPSSLLHLYRKVKFNNEIRLLDRDEQIKVYDQIDTLRKQADRKGRILLIIGNITALLLMIFTFFDLFIR